MPGLLVVECMTFVAPLMWICCAAERILRRTPQPGGGTSGGELAAHTLPCSRPGRPCANAASRARAATPVTGRDAFSLAAAPETLAPPRALTPWTAPSDASSDNPLYMSNRVLVRSCRAAVP